MGNRTKLKQAIANQHGPVDAIVYGRVSTDEQQEQGYSLDAQARYASTYIAEKGFRVLEVISTSESAKDPGRKEFNRMMDIIRNAGRPLVVVVEKPDRLFRNLPDFVMIEDLISRLGLEVHYFKERRIISQAMSPADRMFHAMQVLFARNQVENLSLEVKKGMKEKADQGHYPSKPPIGYVIDPQTKGIQLHDGRALIIRQMFEMYAEGQHSIDDLRVFARRNGLAQAETGRGSVSKSTVDRILKNIFYLGSFTWAGDTFDGKHAPIVDVELFDKVQAALLGRGGGRFQHRKFAFSCLLRCGYCHRAMTAERQKGLVYYHCSAPRAVCVGPFIREETIQQYLTVMVRQLDLDQRVVDTVHAGQSSALMARTRFRKAGHELVADQVALLEKLLKTWDMKLAAGTISDETYQARRPDMLTELERAKAKVARTPSEPQLPMPTQAADPKAIVDAAADLFASQRPEQQRRFLDFVVAQVFVAEDTLTPCYRRPFDVLGPTVIHLPANTRRRLGAKSTA